MTTKAELQEMRAALQVQHDQVLGNVRLFRDSIPFLEEEVASQEMILARLKDALLGTNTAAADWGEDLTKVIGE